MKPPRFQPRLAYGLLAAVCLLVSLVAGWSSYARRINHVFYDLYFRQRGPRVPVSDVVIVAIDDATLARYGALPLNRSVLAQAVRRIQQAGPRLLALDVLLVDVSSEEADADLEEALAGEIPLVLGAALEAGSGGNWLSPLPRFAERADAVGHVHADPDGDGVSRQVLLSKHAGRQRYWAFALECFRILNGTAHQPVTETEEALEVPLSGASQAVWRVPASRAAQRALLIQYAGGVGAFAHLSLASLLADPEASGQLRGKIVLLGATAQGTGDRLFVPFFSGAGMPGVEIHANILYTLLTGNYLLPAGDFEAALAMLAITLLTLWVLARLHGLAQSLSLAAVGGAVLLAPYGLFLAGQVWPAFSLLLSFGTALLAGAAYQLLVVRRRFLESEAKRRRSQEQFEMAAHEIRTPLAAIQASSELLARYSLEQSKRDQMVQLLYEESQRLGRLVERFLSVERLSAGELALQRATMNLSACLTAILERLRPIAERKNVQLVCKNPAEEIEIEADAELLEFAVSNLLTNAVKYSPAGASVKLAWERDGQTAQIHVSDSGAGLTPEQTRRVFDRFYRAESAERSAPPGFGLGLAIAREIARHHGGDVRVQSTPGAGSRFTISLPLAARSLP